MGAVINYLSDILPTYRKIITPVCLTCQRRIPAWNYLIWPRRCQYCGQTRAKRVWIVEICSVIITLWLWYNPSSSLGFVLEYLLGIYLGTVFVIDIEHHLILHPVSIIGGVLCLVIGIELRGLPRTLLGGVGGFGIMMFLYLFGILFARIIMRWKKRDIEPEGMGFGDVILGGVLGLLLGWPGIIAGVTMAILAAGLFAIFYLFVALGTRRYRSFGTIPYGPFLVIGAILLLFFRDQLLAMLGT
jgi:leader peptidase (prepilin peptidase)/N-methyltransferase